MRRAPPDLALRGMTMPRLDGRELCKRVRSDPVASVTVDISMSAAHEVDIKDCGDDEPVRNSFDVARRADTANRLLAAAS